MTIDPWYVHHGEYNVETHSYDLQTSGPFACVQEAFDFKSTLTQKSLSFIEVNQQPNFRLPNLL